MGHFNKIIIKSPSLFFKKGTIVCIFADYTRSFSLLICFLDNGSVMDLGEEPRGPDPPLPYFGFKKKKKESHKEEKSAGQAKKNRSPSLSSGSGSATAGLAQ